MRRYIVHYTLPTGWAETATIEADSHSFSEDDGDNTLFLHRGDEIVAQFTEGLVTHWYSNEIAESHDAITLDDL